MHLGERDACACKRQRGLDEPPPGKPPEPLPELAERGRQPGHSARGGADRVHDDLLAEAHRNLGEVTFLGRHGSEPVQVPHARAVEDDRMTAGEKAAVHGLGHAGREAHGDDGIRGRASFEQDLGPDLGSRWMACGDARTHPAILP